MILLMKKKCNWSRRSSVWRLISLATAKLEVTFCVFVYFFLHVFWGVACKQLSSGFSSQQKENRVDMESYAVLVLKTSSLGSWQDGACELWDILSAWGGLFAKGTRCAYANQQISSKCFYKPLTSEHTCSESHTHTPVTASNFRLLSLTLQLCWVHGENSGAPAQHWWKDLSEDRFYLPSPLKTSSKVSSLCLGVVNRACECPRTPCVIFISPPNIFFSAD